MRITEVELDSVLNFLEREEYHSRGKNRQHLNGNMLGGLRVGLRSRRIHPRHGASLLQTHNLHLFVEGFGLRDVTPKELIDGDF